MPYFQQRRKALHCEVLLHRDGFCGDMLKAIVKFSRDCQLITKDVIINTRNGLMLLNFK